MMVELQDARTTHCLDKNQSFARQLCQLGVQIAVPAVLQISHGCTAVTQHAAHQQKDAQSLPTPVCKDVVVMQTSPAVRSCPVPRASQQHQPHKTYCIIYTIVCFHHCIHLCSNSCHAGLTGSPVMRSAHRLSALQYFWCM
jgi:hypothetical protein